jgi:hypothetical protein
MKFKFVKKIVFLLAIIGYSVVPVSADIIRDPDTGGDTGEGILQFCAPNADKTCVFVESQYIIVRSLENNNVVENSYTLDGCSYDKYGSYRCNNNFLTIPGRNIMIVDRNYTELLFGASRAFVYLARRRERMMVNNTLVPLHFNLNIGSGRFGTQDIRFNWTAGDRTAAFSSDLNRKTGTAFFWFNSLPDPFQFSNRSVPRRNLRTVINVTKDRNSVNQKIVINNGTIVLTINHNNPAPINLTYVNNGQGIPGVTPTLPPPPPNPNLGTYELSTDGVSFNIQVTTPEVNNAIRASLKGTGSPNIKDLRIQGKIVKGTKSYNPNFNYYLDEDSIEIINDPSYECDGHPLIISRQIDFVGSPDFFFSQIWCPSEGFINKELN